MSSKDGRVTDLFIRIGRPQSSRSSTATGSTTNTTIVADTVRSDSTTPTTTSSKKSVQNAIQRGTSVPASISRYTISGPVSTDTQSNRSSAVIVPAQSTRPSAVHVRRHSRMLSSSTLPSNELVIQKAGGVGITGIDSRPQAPSRPSQRNDRSVETPGISPYKASAAISTPFTPPKVVSDHIDSSKPTALRTNLTSLNATTPEKVSIRSKIVASPPNLSPTPMRLGSHSRSSSRSDRSYPPTSFPTESPEKNVAHRAIRNTLARSQSTRITISASPRSESPLKNQINEHGDIKVVDQYRRHPRRSHSLDSRSVRSNRSGTSVLSEATSVHTVIHHYTTCPHTCPPRTRPLDIQPELNENYDPPYSQILGSCFECDTSTRRDLETTILLGYNPRITSHTNDLYTITSRLEKMSPISPLSPSEAAQFQRLGVGNDLLLPESGTRTPDDEDQDSRRISQSSFMSEDCEAEMIAIRIEVLENRITELTLERDAEIRAVWKGYTQRWGPGTLGVSKGFEADRATITTVGTTRSNRTSINSEGSQYNTPEGRMKIDWIRGRRD